jgi:uncharacterized protein
MAISFYDVSVGRYLQTIAGVQGFLDKGLAHCSEHKADPQEMVDACLYKDMAALRFQIQSVAHHSIGAIEGMKSGKFGPPSNLAALDYAGLQRLMADTRVALEKLTPDVVNALQSRDVTFEVRDMKLPFTAEGFLLSFSLPNFYFHATTAYDILRSKGVPVGKRDFMGPLRLKT